MTRVACGADKIFGECSESTWLMSEETINQCAGSNASGHRLTPKENVVTPFPKLSVIVPHLNEPGELARCLDALDSQHRDGIPFEIIVVDNGSTELPETVCSRHPGVRLELEPIPGPGPARNRGAKVARAVLLAFIDADCIADPGWVRAIVEFMDRNDTVDIIGGDIGILAVDAACLTSVEAYESIFSYRAQLYIERYGFAATGNMAVRAEVFRAVGPFGGISTMEDTEWGQRATSCGYRLAYLPTAKVLTASCKSFSELCSRWDRHVAHEFRSVGGNPVSLLSWAAKSAVLAISPLAEVVGVLRSGRISGLGTRLRALTCLTRIRQYRARQMLRLIFRDDAITMVERWNRENSTTDLTN
jgi:GT2 family glycosyltransferase